MADIANDAKTPTTPDDGGKNTGGDKGGGGDTHTDKKEGDGKDTGKDSGQDKDQGDKDKAGKDAPPKSSDKGETVPKADVEKIVEDRLRRDREAREKQAKDDERKKKGEFEGLLKDKERELETATTTLAERDKEIAKLKGLVKDLYEAEYEALPEEIKDLAPDGILENPDLLSSWLPKARKRVAAMNGEGGDKKDEKGKAAGGDKGKGAGGDKGKGKEGERKPGLQAGPKAAGDGGGEGDKFDPNSQARRTQKRF